MSQDNLFKMKCTVCKVGVYYTTKNKKKVERKIELKKFCKVCRKHSPFKETAKITG